MAQTNTTFQNGLKIHLLSFLLPKDVMKSKEEIRVSITTIPDETKQHFSLEGKKSFNADHVFAINITERTQKIIMVFRRKTILGDNPIIASTTFELKDFENIPKGQIANDEVRSEIKTMNIYYPLQKQIKEEHSKNITRKILGQMQIQLSFAAPFTNIKTDKKNNNRKEKTKANRIQTKNRQEKKIGYEKLSDENGLCNSYLI